jgi:hypothetical protein
LYRISRNNINEAIKQINVLHDSGTPVTVSCLNVILSCLAEIGDSVGAFDLIFKRFDNIYNLKPNVDSYCYALESLGKRVLRSLRHSSAEETKENCILQAGILLNRMEQQNIVLTQRIILEYTELLCLTDLATASHVVFDTYSELGFVHSKIIYRVAMANSKSGNHDIAKKIASLADIEMPNLLLNLKGNELMAIRKQEDALLSKTPRKVI